MGALMVLWPIIGPVITRQLITMAGGAAMGAAGYAISHWGVSKETVAAVSTGAVAALSSAAVAVSKNKSASAIINRIPVVDMLHAVANATGAKVTEIQLADPALADAVPSPKVIPAEGHSQAQV